MYSEMYSSQPPIISSPTYVYKRKSIQHADFYVINSLFLKSQVKGFVWKCLSALCIRINSQWIGWREWYLPQWAISVINGTFPQKLVEYHASAVFIDITRSLTISCWLGAQGSSNVNRILYAFPASRALIFQTTQVTKWKGPASRNKLPQTTCFPCSVVCKELKEMDVGQV